MPQPILYSFRRCPYAIRARMALHYAGIEVEHREISLRNKPEAMLEVSPKGTVPVLVHGNDVIDESIDVMCWALEQSDPQGWLDQPVKHALVQRNDGYFKTWLDRYKYHDRYSDASQQDYLVKCLAFLEELEQALNHGSQNSDTFLFGPKITAVDVAIFPFIRQFAFVDKQAFDALQLPKLQQWLAYFLNSELFNSVMQKYPLWQADY